MNQGRKPKYSYTDVNFLMNLESYAKKGLTDKEIATSLNITPECFSRRKKRHPEIVNALKKGRTIINALLKSKLLQMALGGIVIKGYKHRVTVGDQIVTTTIRDSAPNLQAICNWLYHHDEEWRSIEKKEDIASTHKNTTAEKWVRNQIAM